MSKPKVMHSCDMCRTNYQMGPHIYDGKYIPRYELNVCKICYDGNWDGWSSHYEKKLLSHIEKHNIHPPERNEKGWFPRD